MAGGCGGEKPSPHLAACRAQTAIMPLMAPLPAALRRTHTSPIHTQGNGPACIRPLLPSPHYHPLPSLIGPATATAATAALTNTRAHAHLYHHLHSRFAYPSQGHPPCRHIHQLLPLLGLPSSTTTPPSQSQSQTYPLAAQQQHWPWELRVLAKPTPGPAHVGKCGCCCCAGSPQPPWNDDVRGSFFFKF